MSTCRLYTAGKRRRQVYLKKVSIVLSIFLFAAELGIVFGDELVSPQDNHVNASVEKQTADKISPQKRYKSIQISYGDTLWDIAREYKMTAYDSTKEYVKEIKEVNGLLEDNIHEGQYLTIPYYVVL